MKALHWKYNLHLNTGVQQQLLTNDFDDSYYQANFAWNHNESLILRCLEVEIDGRNWWMYLQSDSFSAEAAAWMMSTV
jgi:hypothetical protein